MTDEPSSRDQPPDDLDIGSFHLRHPVFVRGARDAARQALFFLDLLIPCSNPSCQRAIESHWQPALHQAAGLVKGVHVPSIYDRARRASPGADRSIGQAVDVADAWGNVVARVSDAAASEYSEPLLSAARAAVVDFLSASRAGTGARTLDEKAARLVTHDFASTFTWLKRHLSLLLAVALVLGVSLRVEAVRGLLRHEGLRLLLYLALLPLFAYLHLPHLIRLRRARRIHPWDVGRWGFWRLRPLADAPRNLIPRWPEASNLRRAIARAQAVRLGVYLAGALAGVALIYVLGAGSPVTVPAILLIYFAILLTADQLDLWDFLLADRVRFSLLTLTIGLLAALWLGLDRKAITILFFLLTIVLAGLYWLGRRSWFLAILAGLCLVVGLLLLGGTWTHEKTNWRRDPEMKSFQRLTHEEWPYPAAGDPRPPVVVMAASGGGSRAAIYAALTLERLHREAPQVAHQLQAASGVSGGSLAIAAYVARRASCGPQGAAPDLVEATAEDFLFPTLVGAIIPGRTRGTAIETAWQEGPIGLGDCTLSDLASAWRSARRSMAPAPPFPIPLFNTATLDGHDVVISPLSLDLYVHHEQRRMARSEGHPLQRADRSELADDPFTWVYHRDGIYGLEDFLGNQDLPLSSAVLASANFPFGFPVVKLLLDPKVPREHFFSPAGDPDRLKLTDGGALSNSGMWSLFRLLVNRRAALAERGVLLVIVEASKMPTYRGFTSTFNGLRGIISDQGAIGRNLHERMLDILEHLYGNRLATVQIDLIPREGYNVFTTWALDDRSVERLRQSFSIRWEEERAELHGKWKALQSGEPANGLIDRRRPPLD